MRCVLQRDERALKVDKLSPAVCTLGYVVLNRPSLCRLKLMVKVVL